MKLVFEFGALYKFFHAAITNPFGRDNTRAEYKGRRYDYSIVCNWLKHL